MKTKKYLIVTLLLLAAAYAGAMPFDDLSRNLSSVYGAGLKNEHIMSLLSYLTVEKPEYMQSLENNAGSNYDLSGYNGFNTKQGISPGRVNYTGFFLFFAIAPFFLAFSRSHYSRIIRIFEIAVSVVALIILCPLIAAAAIAIKLTSPGPVFIKQVRVGMDRRFYDTFSIGTNDKRKQPGSGRPFEIYKLRTMYVDAERATGPVWAGRNDSRITPVGSILRKTHLDEIPQFVNVLKGDMGIIGPRPERPSFVTVLNQKIPCYEWRHRIKPGITGLAQVCYPYGASEKDSRCKLKYDLLYMKKKSYLTDISIVLNTLNVIVFLKGSR